MILYTKLLLERSQELNLVRSMLFSSLCELLPQFQSETLYTIRSRGGPYHARFPLKPQTQETGLFLLSGVVWVTVDNKIKHVAKSLMHQIVYSVCTVYLVSKLLPLET